MRKHIAIITWITLALLPGLAGAAGLDAVSASADCDSWTTELDIGFRSGADLVRLEYTTVLVDDLGIEQERIAGSHYLDVPASGAGTFAFSEAWSASLMEGDYTVATDYTLFDFFPDGMNKYTATLTITFTCGAVGDDDPPVVTDACRYSLGHWKHHGESWPVDELTLGAADLDRDALLTVLNTPVRGDATIQLARHLITTKLNLANGAAAEITGTVDAADAWLTMHPLYSKPGKGDRHEGLALKDALEAYNDGDCPEENAADPTAGVRFDGLHTAGMDKALPAENISLGTLKAQYR